MPKRMLLAEQWDKFARLILPAGCSPVQRREMRQAFYGGAEGAMRLIFCELSPGPDVTPADEVMMIDLQAEIEAFAGLIQQGRA